MPIKIKNHNGGFKKKKKKQKGEAGRRGELEYRPACQSSISINGGTVLWTLVTASKYPCVSKPESKIFWVALRTCIKAAPQKVEAIPPNGWLSLNESSVMMGKKMISLVASSGRLSSVLVSVSTQTLFGISPTGPRAWQQRKILVVLVIGGHRNLGMASVNGLK